MTETTKVSLIVVPDEKLSLWERQHSSLKFLDEADKASFSSTSFLQASTASKSFPEIYFCLIVEAETTVSQTIKLAIEKAFPEMLNQINRCLECINEDKNTFIYKSHNKSIEFSLICPTLSSQKLELSTKLSDLEIFDGNEEVVVIKKEIHPSISGSGLNIVRDYTDFQKHVRSYENLSQINDYLYYQNLYNSSFSVIPLVGVFLYTDEDFKLATYIRENFDNLHAMSGKDIEIFFIEEPPSSSFKTAPSFWRARLEHLGYLTWSLLGWARTKPYNKSQAYTIASSLNIYPEQLPCLVIFDEIASSEKVVIPIFGDYSNLFRRAFSDIRRCLDSIGREIVPIETDNSLEYLEYPLHRRKELFQKLRLIISHGEISNSSGDDDKGQRDNIFYVQNYIKRVDSMSINSHGISQVNTGSISGGMQANIGDNNKQSMTNEIAVDRVPTQPEVIKLLAQMEEIIQRSTLPDTKKAKAAVYLNAAKTEAEEEKPDKQLVAKNLEGATKILKAADETIETGVSLFGKVFPTIKTLALWLGEAARALLELFS
jgi:hypothetical protein